MRTIPVDTSAVSFIVATAPQVRSDLATGQVRKNRATGQTLYQVGLIAFQGEGKREDASNIKVTLIGEPKGLTRGASVIVRGLVAVPWEQGDRHGIAYRAESVTAQAVTSGKASA